MNLYRKLLIACALGLFVTTEGHSADKKVSKSELPPAVQKTALEQSKGAIIKGYSKETEDGQLQYEVEMTVDGHSKDVGIAPDGRLLEIEEQVQLSDLSKGVQRGMKAKAHNRQIAKIESITKNGKLVAYEAQLSGPGKHSEIQVGPDGNSLNHEE
jgi:hypothetical protein